MAGHCPESMPVASLGDHAYFAYWVIHNADEYYAEVLDNGADVTKKLRDEAWGMREFGLRKIDGHRIMFGQEIDAQ